MELINRYTEITQLGYDERRCPCSVLKHVKKNETSYKMKAVKTYIREEIKTS